MTVTAPISRTGDAIIGLLGMLIHPEQHTISSRWEIMMTTVPHRGMMMICIGAPAPRIHYHHMETA